MRPTICLFVVILLALTPVVGALPSTGAATDIGNNNFILHATGASGDTFFCWGIKEDWQGLRTQSVSPVGSVVEINVYGAPIMPSTLYYAKACDTTGCGNVVSFTTTEVTLIVERTDEDYRSLIKRVALLSIVAIFVSIFVTFWFKSKSNRRK